MIQVVLNLAQCGLRDFDVAGPPLVLAQLPKGRHVVHGMTQGVVVLVYQAKTLEGRKDTVRLEDRKGTWETESLGVAGCSIWINTNVGCVEP